MIGFPACFKLNVFLGSPLAVKILCHYSMQFEQSLFFRFHKVIKVFHVLKCFLFLPTHQRRKITVGFYSVISVPYTN